MEKAKDVGSRETPVSPTRREADAKGRGEFVTQVIVSESDSRAGGMNCESVFADEQQIWAMPTDWALTLDTNLRYVAGVFCIT